MTNTPWPLFSLVSPPMGRLIFNRFALVNTSRDKTRLEREKLCASHIEICHKSWWSDYLFFSNLVFNWAYKPCSSTKLSSCKIYVFPFLNGLPFFLPSPYPFQVSVKTMLPRLYFSYSVFLSSNFRLFWSFICKSRCSFLFHIM